MVNVRPRTLTFLYKIEAFYIIFQVDFWLNGCRLANFRNKPFFFPFLKFSTQWWAAVKLTSGVLYLIFKNNSSTPF